METVTRGIRPRQRHIDNQSVTLAPVRTPTGSVIGSVLLEGGRRVFRRRVRQRHLYRALDGFSVGEHALGQLQTWRVELIRYVSDDGIFESPLDFFCRYAVPVTFDARKNPETQHVLPRHLWPVRPIEQNPTHETDARTGHVEQVDLLAAVPA